MQGQKDPTKAAESVIRREHPRMRPKCGNVVVVGKTVVLVRHHYAKTGDVEEIFNEYLDDKTGEK